MICDILVEERLRMRITRNVQQKSEAKLRVRSSHRVISGAASIRAAWAMVLVSALCTACGNGDDNSSSATPQSQSSGSLATAENQDSGGAPAANQGDLVFNGDLTQGTDDAPANPGTTSVLKAERHGQNQRVRRARRTSGMRPLIWIRRSVFRFAPSFSRFAQ